MNSGPKPNRPFRRAVLRGLAIVLPPLLTIVLFFQAWTVIESYILIPIERYALSAIVWQTTRFQNQVPQEATAVLQEGDRVVSFTYDGRDYAYRAASGRWISRYPDDVIKERYLKRSRVLLLFIPIFVLILYLLGKFVGAGLGRLIFNSFDALIHRLPVVSNVYSAVKQVTDFVFTEREIEFNRVVAVEYPRKGIWSIGFVTGESMLDIRSVANEPVLSVLMPTSPMPMTGFTITVLKSEAVDLNITVDQAVQFIISCGVVVPLNQQPPVGGAPRGITSPLAARLQGDNGADGATDSVPEKPARETSE